MAYKNILTVVTPEDASVAAPALALAKRCGAGITLASVAGGAMTPAFASGHFSGPAMIKATGIANKRATEAAAAFEQAAQEAGVDVEVSIVQDLLDRTGDKLKQFAHVSDLVIMAQPGEDPAFGEGYLLDALLFGSGRPMLLTPAGRGKALAPGKVLVAWNDSAAAARAVADALPLLRRADSVEVVTVRESGTDFTESAGHLLRQLARHEVNASHRELDGAGRPIGEVLDGHARANDADLLVMGAYGRSRFREFVLGGATRTVLSRMSVPVLMSH
ncbi:MAG: universal stress protein [Salinarimonas sp.]|nr:universal stress protein [Salinarimonas sp.]